MVFPASLFLSLCASLLLPSFAFLSIKPLKVIQKSYNARKSETAPLATQAHAKRTSSAAQRTANGIMAHIGKDYRTGDHSLTAGSRGAVREKKKRFSKIALAIQICFGIVLV